MAILTLIICDAKQGPEKKFKAPIYIKACSSAQFYDNHIKAQLFLYSVISPKKSQGFSHTHIYLLKKPNIFMSSYELNYPLHTSLLEHIACVLRQ